MKYFMKGWIIPLILCLCACSSDASVPSGTSSEEAVQFILQDFRYYAGGDSNGSTYTLSLSKKENVLVLNESPSLAVPVLVSEYNVTSDTYEKIEERLDPDLLQAWSEIEAEEEILDGPGNSYMVRILVNEEEKTYFIDGYADLGEGNAVMKEILETVKANMTENQMRDQYLLNEEERISDAEISSLNEETIMYLMSGYWHCISEITDAEPADHGIGLMIEYENCYYWDNDGNAEYAGRIVKEPLDDLDSDWYASFENEEHSFYAVLRGAKLLTGETFSDETGTHMRYCVFDRSGS